MVRTTPSPKSSLKPSPAAQITAAILERLEAGTKPWVQPWRGTPVARPLRTCGTPYRGINIFWLWLVAETRGYASPHWMTYRQCDALGGQVRRGETASIAVFYKAYGHTDDAGSRDGHDNESQSSHQAIRRILKSYAVFNADQCDGLPERFAAAPPSPLIDPSARQYGIGQFFERIPADVRHHGCDAYYEPELDRITLPPSGTFHDLDRYFATRAHETVHWVGHKSRLARDLDGRFGSHAYAAEELVAELASAIMGVELGLPVAHLDHHASYIAEWIDLLRHDDRAILTAAARAEEAASLLLDIGRGTDRALDAGVDDERTRAA